MENTNEKMENKCFAKIRFDLINLIITRIKNIDTDKTVNQVLKEIKQEILDEPPEGSEIDMADRIDEWLEQNTDNAFKSFYKYKVFDECIFFQEKIEQIREKLWPYNSSLQHFQEVEEKKARRIVRDKVKGG